MVSNEKLQSPARIILPCFLFAIAGSGLYASSLYSYLLFHSLIEVVCVVVILIVFVLAWNSRRLLDNHYILFLGISFLSSASFELVHMFAFKGFGVFPEHDTNLPTQLWIALRYVFSLSFLIAPIFITRRLNAAFTLTCFAVITTLLFTAIFSDVFPDCFIEGQGLTPFKIYSEYIIIIILFASLGLLIRKRTLFDRRILWMLALSIVSAAAADMTFTQYLSVYGPANLIGHLFLFVSAALIYQAIIVTAVEDPRAIIFRNLEKSEERFRLIAETSVDLIFQWDVSGKVVFCSPAIVQYGYSVADVIGKDFSTYITREDIGTAASAFKRVIGGEHLKALELRLLSADGTPFHVEINIAPLKVNGVVVGLQGISRDVTGRKQIEETLLAHRQLLETVINHLPVGINVIRGSDLRIQLVNPAYQAIAPGKEMVGKTPDELWSETGRTFVDLCHHVLRTGEPHHAVDELNMICRFPGGLLERAFFTWSLFRVRLPGDQGWAILTTGWETTKRMLAVEALRESEQKFRLALRNSPVWVAIQDRNLVYQWTFNQQIHLPGEIIGKTDDAFFGQEEVVWMNEVKQRVLETGNEEHMEHWVTSKSNRLFFSLSYEPLRDSTGEVTGIGIVGVNLTKQKLVEEELQRSEALYRAIGESIDYGVWICAPDGRNTYASESFLNLVGITQEQCSNFGWGDVLHPDDTERTLAAWQECVRTGGKWNIEHRFRGTDGQWHHVLARGVAVRNEQGEIISWAGINLDISELKQAEERIMSSLAEKEVMLREIHHRVKNNLQVISSLVSLQADSLTDERIREELNEVRDRIRSMALVHEKLYQSSNLQLLNFAEYTTSLLHSLWRSHGALAEKVRLNFMVAPVILPIQAAVPCGLILNELAGNALKHAFPGNSGGEVTVGLEQDAASFAIRLRVHDNGVGLPAGLDWRQSRSLGLRLVQILAGQLHGTVDTGTGPGTEFTITFSPKRFHS